MTHEALIERINQLARKQRLDGLTDDEKNEQKALREEYIKGFRRNFKEILSTVVVQEPDGAQYPLTSRRRGS